MSRMGTTAGRQIRRGMLALVPVAGLLVGAGLVACGSDDNGSSAPVGQPDGVPRVVVTYSILGDIVRQLVGDAAVVEVIIPNGQDPHDYSASAHDIEQMAGAAMVVANGLDLEEGLNDALERIEHDGVPVFRAADHITVREIGPNEHLDDASEHEHEGGDPHLWTDPLTIAEFVPALGAQLATALDVDLDDQVTAVEAEMTDLDARVRDILSAVPAGQCILVTGHDSLGYFADRYGCTVIGAIIPSLSSTAEASARDLADLLDIASDAQVGAIFTELGTPAQVAEQVADEAGVPLVELPSHNLPDAGGYQAFITELATKIADGLTRHG
jgi:zinc/manganese transport system substrate-binding protein